MLSRPEGCVSFGTNSRTPQEVPQVHLAGGDIRVQMSTIRPFQCPQNLHKAAATGNGIPEISRHENSHLFGRHPYTSRDQGRAEAASTSDNHPTGSTRFYDQHPEIIVRTGSPNNVSGSSGKLGHHEIPPDREVTAAIECLQAGSSSAEGFSPRLVLNCWETSGSKISNPSSSYTCPPSSTPANPNTQNITLIPDPDNLEQGVPAGPPMVYIQAPRVERKRHSSDPTGLINTVRCIPARLGGGVQWNQNWRPLVSRRETPAHQQLGTSSRHLCSPDIHQRDEGYSGSPPNGQPISSSLYQQDGGDPLTDSIPTSLQSVALVSREEYQPVSRVPSGQGQLNSGSGVQRIGVIRRVDAAQRSLPPDSADSGPMQDGPICNQAEPPAAELYQLEARSVCSGDGCTPPRLEDVGGIRLSPILLNREVSAENSPRGEHHNNSSAMVVFPSLVPSPTGESGGPPAPSAQSQGSPVQPSRPDSPTSRPRVSTASRMQSIRVQYEAAGVSGQATELLLAGWSKGTNTAYQSGWSRWTSWCSKREIDPLSCGVQPFLDFLSDLFREGLKYRTINLIRSAVSMTHNPIESTQIGQHPLVSRLMRGVHNSRPPAPQYSATWDVSIVLRWIKKLGKNEDLSLKDLSGKLALLMALVSANRTSELQALDLRFRVYTPGGVRFKLASLTKKRKAGAPVRERFYASFTKDNCLCVVQCLKEYEEVTKSHRQIRPDVPAPLFLSYIQPYRPVSSQRIAHWIKDFLKRAGVDTSTFKAHSVRGASASAAASGGLHISDVLRLLTGVRNLLLENSTSDQWPRLSRNLPIRCSVLRLNNKATNNI